MADARFAGGWGAAVLKASRSNVGNAINMADQSASWLATLLRLVFDTAALRILKNFVPRPADHIAASKLVSCQGLLMMVGFGSRLDLPSGPK
jgi:hypothetical protein